jgi:Rieske 2Fe-2S family protein
MATGAPASGLRLEPALPSGHYTDPAILERELERIFYRSWLYAGRAESLPEPGDYRTLPVGRESVLVVRGRDTRLRAFYNVCRHRGSRLCAAEQGRLASTIQCSYHAWTYGLDGRLVGAPNLKDQDGFRKEEFGLAPVALETWRGFVFINLEGERAGPFASFLGGMPERTARYPLEDLRVHTTTAHEVEANWKILVENYHECYHCPGVHPELCDLVPLYRSGTVDAPDDGEPAAFRKGAFTFTLDGTSRRPPFATLSEREKRLYNGEALFPNAWINLLPDFVQVRSLWPIGPSRTRITGEWLFEPATMARPDFDPSDAVSFTTLIAEQDWKVCAALQQGVGSRSFSRGIYTPQETPLLEFDRWVLERLGD